MMAGQCGLVNVALLVCAIPCVAATYYVDYEGGSDQNDGTTVEAPFQRCPGTPGILGLAGAVELKAGDTVIFKGGVHYPRTVTIKASGAEDAPITFDGNTRDNFGSGPAVIDGGVLIDGWQRCASAEEAGGNPNWKKICRATIPKSRYSTWKKLNLCTATTHLPVAQDPNPADTLFQESLADYYKAETRLQTDCAARIYPEKGTSVNGARPLMPMITPVGGSGVVSPVPTAAFTVEVPEPMTAVALGIAPQPGYPPVLDAAFLADGKEVLRVKLKKDQKDVQRFDLPKPITFKKLTTELRSMHPGTKDNWTAIRKVAAFDAEGNDQLVFPVTSTLTDPQNLVQDDPDYYEGATLAVHGGHNAVIYLPILEYRPSGHQLAIQYYAGSTYKTTKYAFFNSVRFIDRPGEWAAHASEDGKTWTVFFMPPKETGGMPQDIAYTGQGTGIEISQASHIVVQGFKIIRQGASSQPAGIGGRGKSANVLIRDCEVTMVRGVGITTTEIDDVTVDGCHIHDNPGHTKGIVLRNSERQTIQNCRLSRNTSTGLDFYTCHNSVFRNNTVLDHKGMHANGITAYLGCRNLLVEGNRVFGGNVAFTCQDAETVMIRNNIFSGDGRSCAIGFWTGKLKDVQILNNVIIGGPRDVAWSAGFFTNCRKGEGWVFRNNIIDGLAGGIPEDSVFSHNIYTFRGDWQRATDEREERPLGQGELFVEDPARIFVDPAKRDYRLRVGSPAIEAGTVSEKQVPTDIEGTARPRGKGWDIGAYEME